MNPASHTGSTSCVDRSRYRPQMPSRTAAHQAPELAERRPSAAAAASVDPRRTDEELLHLKRREPARIDPATRVVTDVAVAVHALTPQAAVDEWIGREEPSQPTSVSQGARERSLVEAEAFHADLHCVSRRPAAQDWRIATAVTRDWQHHSVLAKRLKLQGHETQDQEAKPAVEKCG